jgi:hypothetical protein
MSSYFRAATHSAVGSADMILHERPVRTAHLENIRIKRQPDDRQSYGNDHIVGRARGR